MQVGLIDTSIHLNHLSVTNMNVCVELAADNLTINCKATKTSHGNTSLQVMLSELGASQNYTTSFVCIDIQRKQQVLLKVLKAIDSIIEKNVRIICFPIGINVKSPVFDLALKVCKQKNILVIAPSGNVGIGKVLAPANGDDVFSVGAVDEFGQTPAFSGRIFDEEGKCLKPDVSALGVRSDIMTHNQQYIKKSGTSISCATVSGTAAAMLQANPNATAYDIRMALIESCSSAYGSRFGIVNAEKAINLIKTKTPYKATAAKLQNTIKQEKYTDPRLKSLCKQAKRNQLKVDVLIAATNTKELMEHYSTLYNNTEMEYSMFNSFDMVHVKATAYAIEEFINHPDVIICSSTDINYFDF